MTAPILWDFQAEVIDEFRALVAAGHQKIMLVAPTGAGKTVTFSAIADQTVRAGGHVLVLAHRKELVEQACNKLFDLGIDAGILMPGYPHRPDQAVQIASIQTLHARAIRGDRLELPPADLVIVDEAHHARAQTYRDIIEAYPEATLLGVTATPCRGDNRGLGDDFDVLLETPDVAALMALGHLVPAVVYAPVNPDLRGVEVRRGDYAPGQLQERMNTEKLVGDIVEHWFKHAGGRRTIAYASGVQHSVFIRDEFRRAGVIAEHLDGSTPADERDHILRELATGSVEIVSNYGILTEGFNAPDVGCLILARPTKSLGLYRQMIGRGLRAAEGKEDCVVLDHSGAVFRHGLPDEPVTWSLSPDHRVETKAQKARAKQHAPALVNCPECSAVRLEGRACPVCGWRPRPKAKPVNIADGQLGIVDRNRLAATPGTDAAKFHAMLVYIARERGYKPGWVAHKYREKFNAWPAARQVEPVLPTADVRAWVRSRAIAWAKSQKAAAA
jgi:DNA repair protein RadD